MAKTMSGEENTNLNAFNIVNDLLRTTIVEAGHGLDYNALTRGNVAAQVYNITQGGGLEGINLGWKRMESSTDFILSIVDGIDTALSDGLNPSNDEWSDRLAEIADNAVPIYDSEAIDAAVQLQAEVNDTGLLPERPTTMVEIARVALYELASSIAYGLSSELEGVSA